MITRFVGFLGFIRFIGLTGLIAFIGFPWPESERVLQGFMVCLLVSGVSRVYL